MGKLKMAKLRRATDGFLPGSLVYTFECPACGCYHYFNETWKFNGDMNKPTIYPSLKVQHSIGVVCHMVITEGKITFCSDCTHGLKDQIVDMLEDKYDTNS